LPDFRRAYPDIELAIQTTARVVDLEGEDFDCAIRCGLGEWPDLEARLLFREMLVPVARPQPPPGPSSRWPIICARTRFQDWQVWRRATAADCPAPALWVENRAQALEAALAGMGVAITDARYVEELIAAGRLVALGPPVALAEGYYFVRRRQARNPRHVDCLGTWLQAQAASG
jgi:DNA-binding transcriptional LysR family regulator